MKLLQISLIIVILCQPVLARDIDGEFAVFGIGSESCQDYIVTRKTGGNAIINYVDWLEGYLSAFNLIIDNTYDITGGRKIDKALAWLDKYCLSKQDESFVNATAALTQRLYSTRKNLSPDKNNKKKWVESGDLVNEKPSSEKNTKKSN